MKKIYIKIIGNCPRCGKEDSHEPGKSLADKEEAQTWLEDWADAPCFECERTKLCQQQNITNRI